MTAKNKRFRIEDTTDCGEGAETAATTAAPTLPMGQILTEIRELRDLVRPVGKVTIDIVDCYRREIAEVMKLRTDLQEIESSIHSTRKEMASLYAGAPSKVGMDQLSGELGQVVSQTEDAANSILSSAELIDNEVRLFKKAVLKGAAFEQHSDRIEAEISKLFEACHFQDLTGQRIARVSETLCFVEKQVSRMLEIWGGLAAIDHLLEAERDAKATEEEMAGDSALANGPQLVDEATGHVDQGEIDSLFD